MRLTNREMDVLLGWIQGQNNREIARSLGINYTNVSKLGGRIKKKFEARTAYQAISRAYELGILQIERDEP